MSYSKVKRIRVESTKGVKELGDSVQRYLDEVADRHDERNPGVKLSSVASTATLAELITAHNALVTALKNAGYLEK